MSEFSVNPRALEEDHNRYTDAFLNGFCKTDQKEYILEAVTRCFDTLVMERLTTVFSPDDQFGLLGVGVGEGRHEFNYLRSLQSYFKSICNVAVDPNEGMLEKFKSSIATLNSDDPSSVVCHWFPGPLSRFFDESPLAGSKFNMISTMHSLYHTGDFEATFTRLASMLKDNGILFVLFQTSNVMQKTSPKLTWLPRDTARNEELTSEDVRACAQSQGYDVTTQKLSTTWDITEVFDESSEFGNKLCDFFTQTAYFRQTAPAALVDDLMTFWRSIAIEDEDGRYLALASDEILVISK